MIKKFIFSGAMALAALLGISADKLTVVFTGYPIYSEDLSQVKEISYVEGDKPGNYTQMKFDRLDGSSTVIDLQDADEIVYQPDRGENPVKIKNVIPHYHCCELDIEAPEGTFYRVSGMPKAMLEKNQIDPSAWAECLVTDDINYIYYVAEASGISLSQKKPEDVFEYGSQMRPWFPQDSPTQPTEYVIAVYTAKINGDKVEVTSEPVLCEFTSKLLKDEGVKFNLTVEHNSLKMTVKAEAVKQEGLDTDIPFAIDVYTADQIASTSLPTLVSQSISNYEQMVYKYGMSWDDVTFRTSGSKSYNNIKPGDVFLAVAYGLEYGIANTDASWIVIEVPEPEITDDCTFSLASTQTSTTGVNVDIEPSNEATRYVAFLTSSEKIDSNIAQLEAEEAEKEGGEVAEEVSKLTRAARMYVDNRIHYLNQTNPKNWVSGEVIHTGKTTLDSYADMIDGMYMAIGEKYTVVVCGIAEDGGRCTEVSTIEVSTEQDIEVKDLSFEVEFSNYSPSQWYTTINYKITPSDPDATYVAEFLRVSNNNVNLSKTDEQFVKDFIDVQGKNLRLRSGALESVHSMGTEYNSEVQEYVPADYYLIIFGYNGASTTPVYVIRLYGATGDVEQVRGEETILKQEVVVPTEPLTLDMKFSDWNADDTYYHRITCTVTPSDNVNKYVFKVLAADAVNPEGMDAETFLADYLKKNKVIASPGEKKERVMFERTDGTTSSTFVDKYFLTFGYDGEKATTSPILYRVNGNTGKVTPIYE